MSFEKGQVVKNPADPSQTYTVGQRGRKPLWFREMTGEHKPVSRKDVKKSRPTPTGKTKKLSNLSCMINGQFYCASKDATILVDEADEVLVLCQH